MFYIFIIDINYIESQQISNLRTCDVYLSTILFCTALAFVTVLKYTAFPSDVLHRRDQRISIKTRFGRDRISILCSRISRKSIYNLRTTCFRILTVPYTGVVMISRHTAGKVDDPWSWDSHCQCGEGAHDSRTTWWCTDDLLSHPVCVYVVLL